MKKFIIVSVLILSLIFVGGCGEKEKEYEIPKTFTTEDGGEYEVTDNTLVNLGDDTIYHKLDCDLVKEVPEADKVYLLNMKDAALQGYVECDKCAQN